ncbi:hypothetical protein [Massilia niastensis]|uniref:hypothetical protein n=1 Tax=Massilia niastensis TaxID=544911 RepID=UPI0012EC0B9B|nr:hypothetical protein [Massilia niastensis]
MSLNPASLNEARTAAFPDPRRDMRQRDIIARAVAMLHVCGIRSAVEFLKIHAIQPHVIERVLLEPGQRRAA